VIIRKATEADCYALFPLLRGCDRREILLATGDDTVQVLLRSIAASEEAWVAEEPDGTLLGIYGVANVEGMGGVWMLATPAVYRHPKALVQDGRKWVDGLLKRYSILFNFVHAENLRSISWLRKLGFKIGELVPDFGAGKAPFHFFHREPPCASQ
jgi:N-acetylglutamate synthase-like GNAT family acetyltransferase